MMKMVEARIDIVVKNDYNDDVPNIKSEKEEEGHA